MSYYNTSSFPSYVPQYPYYSSDRQGQPSTGHGTISGSNPTSGTHTNMPSLNYTNPQFYPRNPDVQYHAPTQPQYSMAMWNQQQMRYPVPPTYPAPAYAYPQHYHQHPNTVPAGRGYYNGYPQQPAPAAVQAYNQQYRFSTSQSSVAEMKTAQQEESLPEVQDTTIAPVKAKCGDGAEDGKEIKKQPIVVGKRKGGRVLPTGVVKKQKTENSSDQGRKDPWSQYMHEVRRYKEQSCEDDRKNRPLVK